MKNGVECKKCGTIVTPRLWHENMNSLIHKRHNQHICPICGVTMYTTGGGRTRLGNIIHYTLLAALIWFATAILLQAAFNLSNSVSANLAWATLLIVTSIYIARRFFGFTLRQLLTNKKPWQ